MRCPYCKEDNDKVVDSRSGEDGRVTRRRRECLSCSKRYTTYERVEDTPIRVVKKGGERTAFSREKLRSGIDKACSNRPISSDKIDAVVSAIEQRMVDTNEREIKSEQVGEFVMAELKDLDDVAYIRFASVYRKFEDVTEFMPLLQEFMLHNSKKLNGEGN